MSFPSPFSFIARGWHPSTAGVLFWYMISLPCHVPGLLLALLGRTLTGRARDTALGLRTVGEHLRRAWQAHGPGRRDS